VGYWTINAGTAPGRVTEGQVEQLLEQLVADGQAIAPATSYDHHQGSGAAVYQIQADDYPTAAITGIWIFFAAQRAIGLEPTVSNLSITVVADPPSA
jgi:precorrin-4 methylase